MKIQIEVKGTIDDSVFRNGEGSLDKHYDKGLGLYAIVDNDNLAGFVVAEKYIDDKDDGDKKVSNYTFFLPKDELIKTALAKSHEHLSIQFSEAVCKVNDIVSTDKEMMKGIIKHIEDKLQEIADNRGNGISEKTLLEALKIVGNKSE